MVVDCLLPGQIRQLGGKVTYVTARRAVKTAARDCEIRGGEYVSLDRANYATALKVWLPLAEQGDPAAQTYVGEIFEQGLGIQPDPAVAATWYRKAADKGYSRAALNLGTLYEQGRGVSARPRPGARTGTAAPPACRRPRASRSRRPRANGRRSRSSAPRSASCGASSTPRARSWRACRASWTARAGRWRGGAARRTPSGARWTQLRRELDDEPPARERRARDGSPSSRSR